MIATFFQILQKIMVFSVTQKCQGVTMCATMISYQLIWIAFGKSKLFSFVHQHYSSWCMHRKYRSKTNSILDGQQYSIIEILVNHQIPSRIALSSIVLNEK